MKVENLEILHQINQIIQIDEIKLFKLQIKQTYTHVHNKYTQSGKPKTITQQ
jgi:hypothetical protein